MPGFILALPLVLSFRIIRYKKVRMGLSSNYDEIAQTKMLSIFILVPTLTIIYSFIIIRKFRNFYGKIFAILFPFILWLTMRLSQDGIAQTRSFWSLLKMLFLYNTNKKKLIENRKICESLVKNLINKFNINYDYTIVDDKDMYMSQSIHNNYKTKSWIWNMLKRLYYGRVKNDWNETIRLYDVPVDEFHLNDKHEQQIQLSYTFK